MATLSPEQQATAKAFFCSLLYVSKANDPTARANSPVFQSMSPNYRAYLDRVGNKYWVDKIFASLKNAQATLKNITEVNDSLLTFHHGVHGVYLETISGTQLVTLDFSVILNYFAWLCNEKKWFWNNTNTDPAEFIELVETPLGEALAAFDCFTAPLYKGKGTAAEVDNTPQAITTSTKNAKAGASARKVPTYDPVRDYRQLGPLSDRLQNLKNPDKVTFTNPMFCIEADNPNNTTKRTLFITPLDAHGGKVWYPKEVKLGAANGYSDCQIWWDDYTDAVLVLAQINDGQHIKNMRSDDHFQIKKAKPDANGYFYVDTFLGPVYIKASKMNEALEKAEELEEAIAADDLTEDSGIKDIRAFARSFRLHQD